MDSPHWQSGSGDSLRSVHSASSLPQMDEDNSYMHSLSQQNLENISVSEILKQNYEHNGFLYKRAQEKVTDQITELISPSLLSKWQLRYVILYKEHVLYYKNEKCARPKGVFSLRGYNRVLRAEDMTSANQKWAFKIIGMRAEDRTWYFGAASEREMKLWMAYFKVTMERAIHGKARDKSLRILKELKYREAKFVDGREPASPPNALAFEPGIYEDIEEPLEEEEEVDYLPPRLGASITRELPVPPRNESLERGFRSPKKGPLPVPPPRPEPGRRALGPRTQSDPTPPPQRRDRTISCISSPKSRHGSSAPTSPGSRPRLPEPSFMTFQQSELSVKSTTSGDYVLPPDTDVEQITEFRHQYISQRQAADPSPSRPLPIRPPATHSNNQRQGPEGNSFRKKPFVETPNEGVSIKNLRAALKPVVPVKPKVNPKPALPSKPETPTKPEPAARTMVTKEAPFRHSGVREPARQDLLPESCLFGSSDKRQAEGLLFQFRIDGMYLMRLSSQLGGEAGKVLMVYNGSLEQCKHYKVFGNGVSSFSLNSQPTFANMHELLQFYSEHPLPNATLRLSGPYPGGADNNF